MAKSKGGKKKGGSGNSKKPVTTAPQIVATKGGLTSSTLVTETLVKMEDELRVSKKAGRDFMESMVVVIEESLAAGKPVNIGGVVKLTPRFHTKGVREVNEVFGDPTSKKVQKKYPAKVSLKATVMKRAKDALPNAAKMAKIVGG